MDSYVKRYIREELTDPAARHFGNEKSPQYRFLTYDDDKIPRTDLWPTLNDGKLENAANLKFMTALRNPSSSSRSRSTSMPTELSEKKRRMLSAHHKPTWNTDTKHIDRGIDPLQRCLQETLKNKGFHTDYEGAKRELEVRHRNEVAMLKQKMEEQRRYEAQAEIRRAIEQSLNEVIQAEKSRREILYRGERTIRQKVTSEFSRTFFLVVELMEFNQRKKVFKIALQQLDELKVLEREEFLERQLYEKMVKQRELEHMRKHREAELRKKRNDELRASVHSLITEEITYRDRIYQRALGTFQQIGAQERASREVLLRHEIADSIVYEEVLNRQIVLEEHQAQLVSLCSTFLEQKRRLDSITKRAEDVKHQLNNCVAQEATQRVEITNTCDAFHKQCLVACEVERNQILSRAAQLAGERIKHAAATEEEEKLRKKHLEALKNLLHSEVVARSDVSSAAANAHSTAMIHFHCVSQVIKLTERESKERTAIAADEGVSSQSFFTSAKARLAQHAEAIEKQLAEKGRMEAEALAQQLAEKSRMEAEALAQQLAQEKRQAAQQRDVEENRLHELREVVQRQNKPFLGVTLAEHLEPMPSLIVESLYVDGPADMAGVKAGDVIVRVANRPISTLSDMRDAMKEHAVMGELLEIALLRVAELVETKIKVMTANKEFSDLVDIYFDVESHGRVFRQSVSKPSSPEPSQQTPPRQTQSARSTASSTSNSPAGSLANRNPTSRQRSLRR